MSAMLADMKPKSAAKKFATHQFAPVRDTFTVRDMNRQPKVLLAAARKLGRVHVQSRSGERFVIQATTAGNVEASSREDFRARLKHLHVQMRASGSAGFTAEGWKTFSKAIAGE